jgi:hypothetical protein
MNCTDKVIQNELDDMDRFGTAGELTGGRSFDYNTVNLAMLGEIPDKMRTELSSGVVPDKCTMTSFRCAKTSGCASDSGVRPLSDRLN